METDAQHCAVQLTLVAELTKQALRQQHLRRVDIAQQQHTQPQLLREEITSVHSMRRTSTSTTTHSTIATTTTEDGMVVDKSEDETAEAKVAGGNCSQQKCNGGAPDQATDLHTSDGCGRGRSTTRSTTPGSGRGRPHRQRHRSGKRRRSSSMEKPMHQAVDEDFNDDDHSTGTSIPGISTLAVEEELSDPEDNDLDNHEDGTVQYTNAAWTSMGAAHKHGYAEGLRDGRKMPI